MKRSPLKRKSQMKRRSAKQEALYSGPKCPDCAGSGWATSVKQGCPRCAGSGCLEGRREFVARILRERPRCEAGLKIGAYLAVAEHAIEPPSIMPLVLWVRCTMRSVDVHERLPRSAGGSILDDANVVATCRACHSWVHTHQTAARSIGLLRSRYADAADLSRRSPLRA